MAKDMTKGSLVRTLVSFSLPLILSGLLQQLYSWADAFIVGNVEGELSLAAIGATGTVSNLFVMIITGFTLGLSVLAAQQYGSGEREKLKGILSSFAVVLGGSFLALSICGILAAGPLLRLLNTPEDMFPIAERYLKIILAGVPFLTVYNVYAGVLRGVGDSRAPFLSVLVSSVANVLLDLLFVAALHLGAPGAAAATVLSQALMTVFILLYTHRRYGYLHFRLNREAVNAQTLRQGLRLGLPPAIQSSITSVGNLALQNFMNSFGTQTVAAITTSYRIDSLIMLPIINLGSGISTVTAQNIGAGDRRRAQKAFWVGTALMAVVSLCLMVLVLSIAGDLIALFGVGEEAVSIGRSFFQAIAVFYLVYGLAMSTRGFLEGLGDMTFSSLAGISSLGVRVLLSYTLGPRWGNMTIAYAEIFSWILLLVLYAARFLRKRRGLRT